MSEYSTILFAVRDKVAHLTLNRPEAANSLNATLSAEMMDAVVHCEEDADIRAIVVSGTGRFSVPARTLRASIQREANSRAGSRSFTRLSRVSRVQISR